jgi:hypothetical protein
VEVVGIALPILDALEKKKLLALARIWSLDSCACRFLPSLIKVLNIIMVLFQFFW